jgi:hypothetical protein
MKKLAALFWLAVVPSVPAIAAVAGPPQTQIANSTVRAELYLPDATYGYYRATRFDWSGIVSSLVFNGHNYFGQWFARYDPKINDAIQGPVEEFLTNGTGLGYAEAKTGGTFVKIGVGSLRKPEERAFRQFNTYEIVDTGQWTVNRKPDSVEFIQELSDPSGYAYLYRKRVSLTKDKSELVLEHSLKNTGQKVIETSVYEHNFYMLDGQPTGPDTVIRLPFDLHATKDLLGLAEIRGKELVYLKELAKGQSVYTDLEGYGDTAKDYDIRVENRKTGAGVRQTSDRPLSKLVLWSIRTTACPEAYINMRIAVGQESTWRIAYEFYTVPASGGN